MANIDPSQVDAAAVYKYRRHTYKYSDGKWRLSIGGGQSVDVTSLVQFLMDEGYVREHHYPGGTTLRRKVDHAHA